MMDKRQQCRASVAAAIRAWAGTEDDVAAVGFEGPKRDAYIQEVHDMLISTCSHALGMLQDGEIDQQCYDLIIDDIIGEAKDVYYAWLARYREQVSSDDIDKISEDIYDQLVLAPDCLHALAVERAQR